MPRASGTLLLAILAAAGSLGQISYQFPPLAGTPQDKATRARTEVETVARRVLEAYADKKLAGYGKTDNTAALQQAVKDARDTRLVTYLPPGDYLVRDTIQCVQGTFGENPDQPLPGDVKARAGRNGPC